MVQNGILRECCAVKTCLEGVSQGWLVPLYPNGAKPDDPA